MKHYLMTHIVFFISVILCVFLLLFNLAGSLSYADARREGQETIDSFLKLPVAAGSEWLAAYSEISKSWNDAYIPMLLEVIFLERENAVRVQLFNLLGEKTGQNFGYDFTGWYEWLWNKPPSLHPQYADFKSELYGQIDPKFKAYFDSQRFVKIRLDEVLWGGVLQDGIPPLRKPRMIKAGEADYLDDENIVFGLEVNRDVRAYPKRILAWHEMFVDEVGGVPVTGVYCTLCGSMILYRSEHDGKNHSLGTSGFLYRSNKLMYDQETQSLWNTLWGEPVIGPLAQKGISLQRLSVVTTTWGEWRQRHPETTVLSLETGYQRNYAEGAAYQHYFATDQLMFPVPKRDLRLKNKDEVIGLILSPHLDKPLAISVNYLSEHRLFHTQIETFRIVVLTDKSGAIRVYETKNIRFSQWDQDHVVVDENGISWVMTESSLQSPDGDILYRMPAHRSFWFGWFSAYAHTRLIR